MTTITGFMQQMSLNDASLVAIENKQPSFEITERVRYQVKLNKVVTDLFELKKEEIQEIVEALNFIYKQIEDSMSPAAGYEVHIIGGKGKNPLEAYVEACGKREKGSNLNIPRQKECVFCHLVKENNVMEDWKEEVQKIGSLTAVVKTLQNNPLSISTSHKEHWFELNVEEQMAMLKTGHQILLKKKKEITNYEFHTHIAKEGHQNMGHVHLHVKSGLNS
jgi:diadenosine tetraphosphate (Ap4A) HIT family hydrolase